MGLKCPVNQLFKNSFHSIILLNKTLALQFALTLQKPTFASGFFSLFKSKIPKTVINL